MLRPRKTILPLLVLLLAPRAHAEPPADAPRPQPRPRLALVGLSDNLAEAVATTLSAWPIEIERLEHGPSETAPVGSAEAAKQIAGRARCDTVVWISNLESTTAVWVFDADNERVAARTLSGPPPYDEPTAAAVALTIKTLLLHSRVAPREPSIERPPDVVTPPPPPFAPSPLRPSLAVAARLRPGVADELRLGFGVDVAVTDRFLASARARVGLGRAIATDVLDGNLSTHEVSLGGALRLGDDTRFVLDVGLDASLTLSRLQVSLPESERVTRVNPGIDARVVAGVLGRDRIVVGLEVVFALPLRRQRYRVQGDIELALPRFEVGAGVVVRFRL